MSSTFPQTSDDDDLCERQKEITNVVCLSHGQHLALGVDQLTHPKSSMSESTQSEACDLDHTKTLETSDHCHSVAGVELYTSSSLKPPSENNQASNLADVKFEEKLSTHDFETCFSANTQDGTVDVAPEKKTQSSQFSTMKLPLTKEPSIRDACVKSKSLEASKAINSKEEAKPLQILSSDTGIKPQKFTSTSETTRATRNSEKMLAMETESLTSRSTTMLPVQDNSIKKEYHSASSAKPALDSKQNVTEVALKEKAETLSCVQKRDSVNEERPAIEGITATTTVSACTVLISKPTDSLTNLNQDMGIESHPTINYQPHVEYKLGTIPEVSTINSSTEDVQTAVAPMQKPSTEASLTKELSAPDVCVEAKPIITSTNPRAIETDKDTDMSYAVDNEFNEIAAVSDSQLLCQQQKKPYRQVATIKSTVSMPQWNDIKESQSVQISPSVMNRDTTSIIVVTSATENEKDKSAEQNDETKCSPCTTVGKMMTTKLPLVEELSTHVDEHIIYSSGDTSESQSCDQKNECSNMESPSDKFTSSTMMSYSVLATTSHLSQEFNQEDKNIQTPNTFESGIEPLCFNATIRHQQCEDHKLGLEALQDTSEVFKCNASMGDGQMPAVITMKKSKGNQDTTQKSPVTKELPAHGVCAETESVEHVANSDHREIHTECYVKDNEMAGDMVEESPIHFELRYSGEHDSEAGAECNSSRKGLPESQPGDQERDCDNEESPLGRGTATSTVTTICSVSTSTPYGLKQQEFESGIETRVPNATTCCHTKSFVKLTSPGINTEEMTASIDASDSGLFCPQQEGEKPCNEVKPTRKMCALQTTPNDTKPILNQLLSPVVDVNPKEMTSTSEKTSVKGNDKQSSAMEFDLDALLSITYKSRSSTNLPALQEMSAHDTVKCHISTSAVNNVENIDKNAVDMKAESQSCDQQNDREENSSVQEITTQSTCSVSSTPPLSTESDENSNKSQKHQDNKASIPSSSDNTLEVDTECFKSLGVSEMEVVLKTDRPHISRDMETRPQPKAELSSAANNSNSHANTHTSDHQCILQDTKTQPQPNEELSASDSISHANNSTIHKVKWSSTVAEKSEYKPCILPDCGIVQTKDMKLKSYTKRMKIDKCTPGSSPLHLASMKGLLEAVKVLVVEFEIDPNVRDTNYQATPLHHAAQNGHTDVIKYFINVRICDPEVRDMNGLTPLHYASRKGHETVVKSLCDDHNCNPEAKDHQQQTALHYACHFGHKNIVEFLDKTKSCNLEILDGEMRTPLHFACEFRQHEIVCYLVHKKKCNTNAQDIRGRTPLHYACIWWKRVKYDDDKERSCEILKELLSDPKCDVNKRTKDGDTALHLACNTDRLDSVRHLLSKPGCNPNGRNNAGQTPLQLTSHLDVIEELISKGANPMLSVMYKWQKPHDLTTPCTCLNSWSTEEIRELTRSGMKPMELFTWLIEQINEDKALEAIQSIIENTSYNFDTPFRNGCNALHLACNANRANIVECLLVKRKCNPNIKTKTGCTPLQLSSDRFVIKHLLQNQANPTDYLRSLMFKKQERYLLDIMKYLTEDAKWQIDIALLLACEANQPKVVQFLLAEKKCNPNAVNSSKHSPIQLTSDPDIIKLLLLYGANPVDVYKFHGKILGTKHPLCPSVKVFIVGDPSVGKSSLTAALQDEPAIEMLSRPRKVSGVDEKTAGIIPYEFHSRKYGRITLYDFAGQREYYGSHAALLCNAIQSSPPVFLLVVNLNKDDEIIKQNIIYWLSFLESQCTCVTSKPHIIIIGSHADILLERKEDPEEKRHIVTVALEAQLKNMEFVGFYPMNCSYTNTSDMKALRSCMKKSITSVRSQSISFSVHCFQVYLHDKFRDEVAVRLKDIQKQVKIDCGPTPDRSFTFTSFVPANIKDLCEFCKELSDQGHILFLNNPSTIEDSWIIIDKSTLLSEVTGSVFAPASFKEHINLASSTGVVPISKIKTHFSSYDPDVIVGYFSHLEFCHEVSDNHILHLLDKTCSECERHFFFSGLVTLNIPEDVWKPKPQQFGYHCGWIFQCKKQGGFFIPRFVEVLLLRLAFDLALAMSPDEIDDTLPAIQRECSIWTKGIFWGSKSGPQVLVEICKNETIIVLMRCEDIHLIECIEYRPKILKAVFQCAKEFCQNVQTQEFFLDPSEITEYPLVKKSLTELTRYPIEKIANTCVNSDQKASVVLPNASSSLNHLLRLEPYAVLKRHLLEMVLQEGSKKVSDLVLREISACGCENALFINIFDPRLHIQNSEETFYRALVKWRDKCGGTFYHLQQRLSQFSIFAGREAKIIVSLN